MYAIVDIETTGGHASQHRITEVAVICHDGKKPTRRFETLIDPEIPIPAMITQLTGIDDAMVASAPTFSAIADELMEILKDKVFVAHNVNFDHSFLKREFQELGMKFLPKKLCTVRMSRKIIPEAPSYGLGRLCGYLGIDIKERHRAGGDAMATAELLTILLHRDSNGEIEKALNRRSREATLPANLPRRDFERLSEKAGVYQFLDRNGRHLYVGKSRNLKKRVLQHFTGSGSTKRDQTLKREVHAIEHVVTGSELVALLEESHLIRQHWPLLNKAQKLPKGNYGVVSYVDRLGRQRMVIKKLLRIDRPLIRGRNIPELREALYLIAEDLKLCRQLVGLHSGADQCETGINKDCACNGGVSLQQHNERVHDAIELLAGQGNLTIVSSGRHSKEKSLVHIEKGQYVGYSFVPKGNGSSKVSGEFIPRMHNDDSDRIIQQALRSMRYTVLNGVMKRPSNAFHPV